MRLPSSEVLFSESFLSNHEHQIIAISGEYEAGVLTGQPVSFLAKPFNLDTLLDMLGGKPN